MGNSPRQPDLAPKALERLGPNDVLTQEDLDRNRLLELGVAGSIDRTIRTTPNQAEEFVTTAIAHRQLLDDIGIGQFDDFFQARCPMCQGPSSQRVIAVAQSGRAEAELLS